MRLRLSSTEARPDGAGVSDRRLVEGADRSIEPGLRHVAEATGLVPLHRNVPIVEDQLAEQRDLLKAVQRGRPRSVERFSLDAVDLLLDRRDFLLGGGWNPIPIG